MKVQTYTQLPCVAFGHIIGLKYEEFEITKDTAAKFLGDTSQYN